MRLPFTRDQFLEVFRSYNDAIGIAPLLLTALAAVLLILAGSRRPWRHRVIAGGLATMWLWSGVVYHWGFFSAVNPAARVFGALFAIQAAVLVAVGVVRGRMRFDPRGSRSAVMGWVLAAYAMVVYPILGALLGHGYPNGPSFGAPCPVTLFFLGMTFWMVGGVTVTAAVIPLAWALIGTSAALGLGIYEDSALAISAILVIGEMIRRHAQSRLRTAMLRSL
jgi:hypothetical protein